MPEAPDYYELLGIDPDAGDDDVRAAHRRAASYWHPDRNQAPNASSMMRHVNNARDTLLSASKRRDYNLESRAYQQSATRRTDAARQTASAERSAREERQRQESKEQEERAKQEAASADASSTVTSPARNPVMQLVLKRLFVRVQPAGILVPFFVTGLTVLIGYAYINFFGDEPNNGVEAARPPTASPATSVPSTPPGGLVPTLPVPPSPAPTASPITAPTPLPTATPAPAPTATPTPTIVPTATPTATPTPVPSLLIGPVSGALSKFEESSALGEFDSAYDTGVSAKNFRLEVQFENAFSSITPDWSYGVVFRQAGDAKHLLTIEGDGSWRHFTGAELTGFGKFQETQFVEPVTAVSLLVIDTQGFLFVNEAFSGLLDLSSGPGDGGIALVQGVFPNDDLTGGVTEFRGLKITEMNMSVDDPSGVITVDSEPISVSDQTVHARNVVMTAEFLSPYASFSGNWSFGFHLRETPDGAAHYVLITDSKEWSHYRREGSGTEPKLVFKADAPSVEVAGGKYSRLTIVVDDTVGYVLINDVLVSSIGLVNPDAGSNGAVAAFFAGDQPAGSQGEYRNLAIWEFDE